MGAGASSASPGNTKAAVIGELPEGPAVPHTALEHGNELPERRGESGTLKGRKRRGC